MVVSEEINKSLYSTAHTVWPPLNFAIVIICPDITLLFVSKQRL